MAYAPIKTAQVHKKEWERYKDRTVQHHQSLVIFNAYVGVRHRIEERIVVCLRSSESNEDNDEGDETDETQQEDDYGSFHHRIGVLRLMTATTRTGAVQKTSTQVTCQIVESYTEQEML